MRCNTLLLLYNYRLKAYCSAVCIAFAPFIAPKKSFNLILVVPSMLKRKVCNSLILRDEEDILIASI